MKRKKSKFNTNVSNPMIPLVFTKWSAFKIVLLFVSIFLFAFLAIDITGAYHLEGIDQTMISFIVANRTDFLTGFFKVMTNMVNPAVMLVVSMLMIHMLRQRRYLIALFVNLVLTLLLNLAIKGNILRDRPPLDLRLVTESGYSFPSGHSMMSASFYGFLIFLLLQTEMKKSYRNYAIAVCLLIILLVGFSRIYLGVHYTTDVFGGYLVSAMYLLVYTFIVKIYLNNYETVKQKRIQKIDNRMISSFGHAFAGIAEGIRNEKNMTIHYFVMGLVIVFGITLRLSSTEWYICLILCALVIGMELMNTAVEMVVDMITKEYHPLAKKAKDMAAGAVLVVAIVAAIIGGMIFIPKLILLFS